MIALAGFALFSGRWGRGLAGVLVLAAVFLVRDLGHVIGMRAFRADDPIGLTFPFLAPLGGHGRRDAPTLERALVLLSGPGLGLLLGVALVAMGRAPLPRAFGHLLVLLDFVYLLPVPLFEGGRFVERVIPDRWLGWEAAVRAVLAAAGVLFAICIHSWWSGLLAISTLLGASFSATLGRVATALRPRWPLLPQAIEEVPMPFFVDADAELTAHFEGTKTPSLLASHLRTIHARLGTAPLAPWHLALLFVGYLALLVTGAACLLASPP